MKESTAPASTADDWDAVEELPDTAGLVPLRSLDQLRAGALARPVGPRERLAPAAALRRFWGYHRFRPLQEPTIAAVLAGQDCLVVLPTGGGKSLCYQAPAACGAGLVLVVSPLIALMDDQVAAAREAGLSAAALHANLAADQRRRTRDLAMNGGLDLLYVSPERLVVGDLLPALKPALLAVDEAHCVSHWGHDFRPEYRQLRPLFDLVPKAPRLALTATATPHVQDDIAVQLGLRTPLRLVGYVDRPNLCYRALPRREAAKQVLEVIRRHPREGGIVYAQTRNEVDRLAATLAKAGVHCAGYHAGMDPAVRERVQREFVNEDLDVVVATIAFGMGIDRSNVRYVIHANLPKSIEHYQQEAGRAGRDGLPAECVLLASAGDLALHRRLALKDGPLAPDRERSLDRQLRDIGRFAVAPVCRHRLLVEHFGQDYRTPDGAGAGAGADDSTARSVSNPSPVEGGCAACDVCLGETEELPTEAALVAAQKIISAVWRTGGRFGAQHVVDVLRGQNTEKAMRAGHQQLALFGLLKDEDEHRLRAWIDQLLVQGLLRTVEDGVYSFLDISDAGRALCKGQGTVRLGRLGDRPARSAARRSRATPTADAAVAGAVDLDASGEALFEILRALRRSLAQQLGVPPYLVFNDVTLRALADARPTTLEAMRGIKGIGDAKLARYGAGFLAAIVAAPARA